MVDTGHLGVILHFDDIGRSCVILHFDDIWDLSILGYLENIGMAGSQTWELTATDTSLRGVKVCLVLFYLFIHLFLSVCQSFFLCFDCSFLSFFLSKRPVSTKCKQTV